MELEEHLLPDEPREDTGPAPSEPDECPAWVDAYEF